MQFLLGDIESMCIAAEVTLALLLLAFAWPSKREKPRTEELVETGTASWEPVKTLFVGSVISHGISWMERQKSRPSEATNPALNSAWSFIKSKCPEPWTDRMTGLLNRPGIDAILDRWLELDASTRTPSCTAMLSLDDYSGLMGTHHTSGIESILKAIANAIDDRVGSYSIVARYQLDRFLILSFGTTQSEFHRSIAQLQKHIASPSLIELDGKQVAAACTVCIAELGESTTRSDMLETIDDGMFAASEQGGNRTVGKVDDSWVDEPPQPATEIESSASPSTPTPTTTAESPRKKSATTQTTPTAETEENTAEETESSPATTDVTADDNAAASKASTAEAPMESSDVTAVANADDIAALFASINKGKSEAAVSTGKPAAATPAAATQSAAPQTAAAQTATTQTATKTSTDATATPAPTATQPPAAEINTEDAVSSPDDIAALFAAFKPTGAPAEKTSAPPAPVAAPATAPAAPPKAEEPVNTDEFASADDIAALFASHAPAAKKPATSEPRQTDAPKPAPAPAAAPAPTPVAAQPAIAATTTAETTASATANATPKPANLDEIDKSEIATADDVAALFAALRPNTPAPNKPSKPATTEPESTAQKPSVAATAQPAAAKPATSQPTSFQKPPEQPEVKATSNAAPTVAPAAATPAPISIDEIDKNEIATADDVAALFAALKPNTAPVPARPAAVAPAATQNTAAPAAPTPTVAKAIEPTVAKTEPPKVVEIDPTEPATADDVAALFAAFSPLQSKATGNETAKATVTAPAPTPVAPASATVATKTPAAAAAVSTPVPTPVAATPAPAPKPVSAAVEPPAPSAPAIDLASQDLTEAASADDIAALFAALNR